MLKRFFRSIKQNKKHGDLKTRQRKNHLLIIVDGKTMKVWQYIEMLSKQLPEMSYGGKRVDHLHDLKQVYQAEGLTGIEAYIKKVQRIQKKLKKYNK